MVLKEFEPSFSRGGDMAANALVATPNETLQEMGEKADKEFQGPKGFEVGYELFSINGKMLGQGEPIRVRQGERVLFHVRCPDTCSGSWRSTAIRSPRLPMYRFFGSAPPSASRRSSK